MPGQLVNRGPNTWLIRIPLGRDARGTRRYHNHTVKGTKKEAEQYRTRKLRELDTGSFVEAARETVGEFLLQYLRDVVAIRVRDRTLADYQSLADRYLIPNLGHRKLGQLSPADIQNVYTMLAARRLSARTIRYAHSVLHGALQQAVRWRKLSQNPAKLVDLPRHEHREMTALDSEQARRFLEAAASDRWYGLWTVLLTCGLRPGEALGLKWSDFDGNRVRIQRALVRQDGKGWSLAEPKTPRARRVVTVPDGTLRVLASHRAAQNRDRLAAGASWMNLDLVFATRTGLPLDYRAVVQRHFKPLLERAGLPAIRPYDLRHSCATLLLGTGENVKVVSERLGHASVTITLDNYAHVLPDMQQKAAERLDGLLFSEAI